MEILDQTGGTQRASSHGRLGQSPAIGESLSHYTIHEKLGEGGMGVVYRAEDSRLKRPVALKFVSPLLIDTEEQRTRFLQEARAAAALSHPNICTVYGVHEAAGHLFISMELVEGQTLKDRLRERDIELREALSIAVQLADGLQLAHERGIFHRDVKPGNVIVTPKGQAKILDFGLAHLPGAATLTAEHSPMGTLLYSSPEQLMGERVDHRTDIWSLGVILYEMTTGTLPFGGEYEQSVMYSIIHIEPAPVTTLRAGLPTKLDHIVGTSLAKNSAQRYQRVDEMLSDLQRLLWTLEHSAPKNVPPVSVATAPAISPPAVSAPAISVPPTGRELPKLPLAAIGVAFIAAIAAIFFSQQPTQTPAVNLTRLSSDIGLTYQPTVSPDGNLVSYSSNRARGDNLDIWVQQLAGGEPVQLTFDEADDTMPAFSHDGTRVAFRSERDGGGIYTVSALGGEPRLLAPEGRLPRFSPDGKHVAYTVGERHVAGAQKIYLLRASGGSPRQFLPEFEVAGDPVWSPDGKHLLFWGQRQRDMAEPMDWWVAPIEQGEPVQTGAFRALEQHELVPHLRRFVPEYWGKVPATSWATFWSPNSRSSFVLTSASMGDAYNIWRVWLKPDFTTARAEQVTFGAETYESPSLAASGELVFSSVSKLINVWSLPVLADQAEVAGKPERLTSGVDDVRPSTARDGKTLLFMARAPNQTDIGSKLILRDLQTGREHTVGHGMTPIVSRDGSRVAYGALEPRDDASTSTSIHVTDAPGGLAKKLCQDCGFPHEWLSDGRRLLVGRREIGVLDTDSGEIVPLIRHPEFSVYAPSLSWDDKWIAFHVRNSPDARRLYVARFRPDRAPPPDEWIAVTDGTAMDHDAGWSPAGNHLYFLSERKGARSIWAQRLRPSDKNPIGAPFMVQRFETQHLSLMPDSNPGEIGLSVAADRLIFSLRSATGNIWMVQSDQ